MKVEVASFVAALLFGGIKQMQAFYLPGVNPQSFAEGDS